MLRFIERQRFMASISIPLPQPQCLKCGQRSLKVSSDSLFQRETQPDWRSITLGKANIHQYKQRVSWICRSLCSLWKSLFTQSFSCCCCIVCTCKRIRNKSWASCLLGAFAYKLIYTSSCIQKGYSILKYRLSIEMIYTNIFHHQQVTSALSSSAGFSKSTISPYY